MSRPHIVRWRTGLVASLGVVLLGGLLLGWRAFNRHEIAVRSLPARPDLSAWPAELGEKIVREEQAARGYFHPGAGLAALSRLYHANGFYSEAMQCYAGLQELEPGEARWPHLLASILAEFGRLDEALPPRQRAVALAPAYVPARLRLGDVLLKANQIAAATKAYGEVLAFDPDNPYALLGLARGAIVGGDWNKAREHLQQAIRRQPDFYGALTLLVTVSEHFGDAAEADSLKETIGRQEFTDLADPWLDGLSEDCYDAYRLSVTAAVARSTGNPVAAGHLLERAIALAPESGSYRRQLGLMLAQSGDYASARRHLEKAVALSSSDADSWLQLFQVLKTLGADETAQRVLATGLAHCPQSPSLHWERARLLKSAGRHVEAIAEFREGYRLRPSEASPLVELAGSLFTVGQTDEALAVLHEGLQKQPEHPMILATLTLYAISMGDEAGARTWWSHVRRQPRTPPQVVNTILQAYQRQFGHRLD